MIQTLSTAAQADAHRAAVGWQAHLGSSLEDRVKDRISYWPVEWITTQVHLDHTWVLTDPVDLLDCLSRLTPGNHDHCFRHCWDR